MSTISTLPKSYIRKVDRDIDGGFLLIPNIFLALKKHGPLNGYEIKEVLESDFGMEVSFGTLYPTMYGMLASGYVTQTIIAKKLKLTKRYALSQKGQDSFSNMLGKMHYFVVKGRS